jgi:NitT/TauT family transport system substrate-binding protein
LAVATVATALFAGTTVSAAAEAHGKPERTQVNISILPTADYAPVVLAEKEGYFKDEGLDVTVRKGTTATAVTGLIGDAFQAGGVNWIGFITATNNGVPIVGLGEADRGSPGYTNFLVKADSTIRKPADLVGKKVAVVSVNGNCDILLNAELRQEKVDYKSIHYVRLNIPDMGAMIARGGVDAACVPEPLLSVVKAQGGVRSVMDLFTGPGDDFPITGISVTAEFVKKYPNTAAALQRAIDRGRALAVKDPAKVRAVLPTYTSVTPELAAKLTLPRYPVKSDKARLQYALDMMKSFGIVKPDAKAPTLVGGG